MCQSFLILASRMMARPGCSFGEEFLPLAEIGSDPLQSAQQLHTLIYPKKLWTMHSLISPSGEALLFPRSQLLHGRHDAVSPPDNPPRTPGPSDPASNFLFRPK